MNQLSLVGRIVRTPILRDGTKPRVNFTIAVDRAGEGTDWIPCVAWGPTATAIAEYTDKGHLVAIEGRLTTGKYTNDAGETIYTMDVAIARCDFLKAPGFPRRVTGDASTSEVAPSEPVGVEVA